MDTGRWQQIDRLLDEALGRAPEERADFLAEACGSDAELRREVESLLAAHGLSGDFIEGQALDVAARFYAEGEALARGRRVGRYVVESLLGRGGMGEVYLARDTELRRPVALKVVSAEPGEGQDPLRRFEQEALAASALNHPNIMTVYEVGRAGPLHYIASEFIDGVTLRQRLHAGPVGVAEALDVAIQVASALAAAHAAGIIHRDIKPENVMLRPDGYVKVLDFGIAKYTPHGAASADTQAATQRLFKTATGLLVGTVNYMSPEHARGLQVDARTDIWSLGCVLYEMCAARPPFGGATSGDVLVSVLDREPPDLARVSEGVPAELSSVVAKALRKDRGERYASAEEMGRELKSLKRRLESGELTTDETQTAVRLAPQRPELSGEELPAHAETVTRIAARSTPEPAAKRSTRPLALVLVAAALLLAVGVWAYTRRATAPAGKAEVPSENRAGAPAAPERALAYSVTVQKYRDGKPYERPFDLAGEILFEKDYRVRLNFRSGQSGHLYILNERPTAQGGAAFNVLFPSPTANDGSSYITPDRKVQIPGQSWFSFDSEEGTETVWLVWSAEERPELEALKRFANPDDRGQVADAELPALQNFLKTHARVPPEVSKDEERRETIVRARGDVLAHALKLQHH
ncbi:MAG TPA: protein kinase [Pyrinomonadaceae bacterium]|nr:protein kinase [Pyrinomonadaceae bacterium]